MSISIFREIAEILPEAMLLVDVQGNVLSANKAAARLLAIEGDTVPKDYLLKESSMSEDELIANLKSLSRSRALRPVDVGLRRAILRANGFLFAPRSLDQSALCLIRLAHRDKLTSNFSILNRLIETNREDSRRLKASEEKRVESEQQFSSIYDHAPSVIYIKDLEGRYMSVNNRFGRLLNIGTDAIIGKTDLDLFPKTAAHAFMSNDREVINSRKALELEEHLPHADGLQTYLSIKFPLFNAKGDLTSICGISTEITQRVEAAEKKEKLRFRQLNEARLYNQALIENSPVAFTLCNMERLLIDFNQAFLDLLGYTEEEAKKLNLRDITPRNYLEQETHNSASLESTRRYGPYEKEYIHKDGRLIPVRLNGLIIEQDGQPYIWSVVESIKDQHERQQALITARNAALDATNAKNLFLANMSHEIRTPMTTIIGLSQLVLKTDLDSKQRDYLEKVCNSANGLLNLINDILDFSKIESGKLDLEKTDFYLQDVLHRTSDTLGLRAREKNIELLFHTRPGVPNYLKGDPYRLGQILLNICGNAIKFSDEASDIVIKVERDLGREDVCVLKFSVRDSGIGIAPDKQEKIFESFIQSDNSDTRKFGGSGLGLAISKLLCELMGGQIWVDSKPGEGSDFQFTVTFIELDEDLSQNEQSCAKKKLHVLVVDDNDVSRQILLEYLQGFGFQALEADCGEKAIAILESAQDLPIDLVLMDWKMPGMDGIETARYILESKSIKKSPKVMMVTAYDLSDVRQAAADVDIEIFLPKPVFPSTLLNCILETAGMNQAVQTQRSIKDLSFGASIQKLNGVKILLVEDNKLNQEMVRLILQDYHMDVEVANNGKEAIDMLHNERFDCVLMDCQMPVMDGYEATKEIRSWPEGGALPIIALTANAMLGDREKILEMGMNAYIAKPIDVEHMLKTIAACVDPVHGKAIEE